MQPYNGKQLNNSVAWNHALNKGYLIWNYWCSNYLVEGRGSGEGVGGGTMNTIEPNIRSFGVHKRDTYWQHGYQLFDFLLPFLPPRRTPPWLRNGGRTAGRLLPRLPLPRLPLRGLPPGRPTGSGETRRGALSAIWGLVISSLNPKHRFLRFRYRLFHHRCRPLIRFYRSYHLQHSNSSHFKWKKKYNKPL